MTTFVTTHTVLHDGREYPTGTPITLDDATQGDVIAALRRGGAIALAVELQAAEDTQAQLDAKEAELAQLRAELAAAREAAAGAAATPPAPTGKAAKAAQSAPSPSAVGADGEQPLAQP
jgi:peptidoglycan hydrolase CwlO-like protein